MNFISNNPSSIPICHICNTSKSIEQFSKSQRKRFKNKKTATCKQCQENPKAKSNVESKLNHNYHQKQFSRDAMCIVIPQPYASFMVHGFYRFLPLRSLNVLQNYKGVLWITSRERHSRSDAKDELASLIKFYNIQNINPPTDFLKLPKHMPLSCLLGCVYLNGGEEQFAVENVPVQKLTGYEKSLRFVCQFTHPKRLLLPLQMDLTNIKSNVITLNKSMLESAKLQGPKLSMYPLPLIQVMEIKKYQNEQKKQQQQIEQKQHQQKQQQYQYKIKNDGKEQNGQGKKNEMNYINQNSNEVIIVWFRQDFRVMDNPALFEAAKTGKTIICIYIHPTDEEEGNWPMGGATSVWLNDTLIDLSKLLMKRFKLPLLVAKASNFTNGTFDALKYISKTLNARYIYFNRVYEPWKCKADAKIKVELLKLNVLTRSFKAVVLYEPWDARCDEKDAAMRLGFGSVGFFLRACQDVDIDMTPLPIPKRINTYKNDMVFNTIECKKYFSRNINDLNLYVQPKRHTHEMDQILKRRSCRFCNIKLGTKNADQECPHPRNGCVDWAKGIRAFWDISEIGAHDALEYFLENGIHEFDTREKHRADRRGTSMISPYMRFGQISARQVLHEIQVKFNSKTISKSYIRKFAWRDLSYWFLWRFPNVCDVSFRPAYENQSWTSNSTQLKRWQRGQTGYPLVDAAMRQLWLTGWQPNYLRHIVAGFLIEYCNIDWKHGFRWFHDCLV